MAHDIAHGHDDHHHGPAKGITRWLYTTNHKDIGSMYLWFSFAMFLLGGVFALVIRAELFQQVGPRQRLGERIRDPVVVELQDARIEQRDMRLVASDQPLHLPHRLEGLFLGLRRIECVRSRVVVLVAVLGVVRITTRAEEGAVERREGRVPQGVAEDEHVERRGVVVLVVEREHIRDDLVEVRRDGDQIDTHLLGDAGDVVAEGRPKRVVGRRRGDQLELADLARGLPEARFATASAAPVRFSFAVTPAPLAGRKS